MKASFIRAKDFDHEDVELEFTAGSTLLWFVNFWASCGVFAALMLAIAFLAQVPES